MTPLRTSSEPELSALLDDGSARYQRPRRMGTVEALVTLLASTCTIVPRPPQGKMGPHRGAPWRG